MIADDLFAGAGGWDLAAQALGVHARGVELMPEAQDTRTAAGLITIHDDVWTFEPDGQAAGLIASPPCQTFSAAGKGSGRKALDDVLEVIAARRYESLSDLRMMGLKFGDERTALVLTPLHFAMAGGYRWLAWEQVPTVLPVWEACAEVLRCEGWHVWTGLLQAEQYGVPQTRKRAFLLASLDGPVEPPAPTHSKYYTRSPEKLDAGVLPWVSMASALGWGLSDRADWQLKSRRDSAAWVAANGPRDNRTAERPAPTVTGEAHRWGWLLRGSNHANAAIRHQDQPAPTVMFGAASNDVRFYRAGTTERGVAELADTRHPESRRLTVAEAGILQSFPADFPWQGKQGKQFLQCGNAVPPGLASAALSAVVPAAVAERGAA